MQILAATQLGPEGPVVVEHRHSFGWRHEAGRALSSRSLHEVYGRFSGGVPDSTRAGDQPLSPSR
jgi:hypothetical protein